MSTDYHYKMIIDPVHGDVGLSELETKIIDTPTFQRLRRLKQLGFASFVYPNASYSRFAHSLGVLYLASRVTGTFHRQNIIDDNAVKKLRLAALLHDVGHYPYSHLMEYIEWEKESEQFLQKKDSSEEVKGKERIYPSHETLSKIIVTKRKDIVDLLEREKIDPEEIAALVEGEHPEIPNILHKSLDVDRLDYLVRDAHNTGLPYGRVDLNYILNNLEVSDEGEIVLRKKARLSAEHLLLARYFMFNAVYCHKTIFGFEELVRETIKLLADEGKIYSSGEEIEKMITEDSVEFLFFDDSYLDKSIDKCIKPGDEEVLNVFCSKIKFRQPPKLVHEETELCASGSSERYTAFRLFLKNNLEQTLKECGYDNPAYFFWREPKDISFEPLNPFVSLSRLKDIRDEEIRELVKINDNGNIVNLVEDKSSVISYLSPLKYKSIRLYTIETDISKLNVLRTKINTFLEQ